MGTQCWVYCAIMFCEGILCVKNGRELFSQTHTEKVISWLAIQFLLSTVFVTVVMLYNKYRGVSFSNLTSSSMSQLTLLTQKMFFLINYF